MPRLKYLVCLAGLGLMIFNIVSHYSMVDDAYISFRYVDNWLAGDGLAYNRGERVEGYTNFLWVALLVPPRFLGVELETASTLLSLLALTTLLWAVFSTASNLAGSRDAGWAALLLAAGSVPLASWTVSGMETVGFAALLALANQRLAVRRRHSPGSSLAFGLAVLTRPPGALHAAVAFAAALPWRGTQRAESLRRLYRLALLFLVLPILHLVFRLAYYGSPLPNTVYAKLGGTLPSLTPYGLDYLWRFFVSGGSVLLVTGMLVVFTRRKDRDWVLLALVGQVIVHMAYVVSVGGDYFPFHRFLVPVIPHLAVLAGVGMEAAARRAGPMTRHWLPAAALLAAMLQTVLAWESTEQLSFERLVATRKERETIAGWLETRLPADSTLAINAAGVIPYRTGMVTIDMLGLNDSHIARAATGLGGDGTSFVGHFKHDGDYVCSRSPDAVLTSGARLYRGRNDEEAIMQAALSTFPGDREFLRALACRNRYRPIAEELAPGRFLVVYVRERESVASRGSTSLPATAEGWFEQGISLMKSARLLEAIEAFEQSLVMNPGNPNVMTNLAFCLADLHRYQQAIAVFEEVIEKAPRHFDALYGLAQAHEKLNHRTRAVELWRRYLVEAPESAWKDRAKEHLEMLTRSNP